MGRENSHKMKTRTMREKGVGATHCKQKKSKGEMAMHYKQKKNCIPRTLIKKYQNLGEKTKTLVGQGLHKFVKAMVI